MSRRGNRLLVSLVTVLFVLSMFAGVTVMAEPVQTEKVSNAIEELPDKLQEYANDHPSKSDKFGDERVIVMVELAGKAEVEGGRSAVSVMNSQDAVKSAVAESVKDVTFRRSFGYLINGFSIVTERKNIENIRAIPGVKSAKEAEQFYPTMSSAVDLTEGSKVWREHHQKGEGMVVAVIDTGVDHNHPDMRLDEGVKVALTKEDVDKLNLPGTWKSEKIPYGYNYADYSDDSRNLAETHGMHVAGIIGANAATEKGVTGEAPNTQILAMKVFSEYSSGAAADDVIAAIEDSVKLGADVINMSLGSSGGFYETDTAYAKAVKNATESGCLVVVSAGNEGMSGDINGGDSNIIGLYSDDDYLGRDTGIVGSPSTIDDALSVASAENSMVASVAYYINEKNEENRRDWTVQDTPAPPEGFFEAVDCGVGNPEDFPADVQGKYALIQRGDITFEAKATNAKAKGAIGAIIYNNAAGDAPNMGGIDKLGLFVAGLTKEHGEELVALSKGDKPFKVSFTLETLFTPNSQAGEMSSFTSWGPTPELEFKPEITAPGGQIYSTIGSNGYGTMSGTSMASPNVAGVAALVGAQLKKDGIELTGREFSEYLKRTLINTSVPLIVDEVPVSPRRQGSGMVQAEKAIRNRVTAVSAIDDKATVSLKDIEPGKAFAFNVKLQNYADEDMTYTVVPGTVYTERDMTPQDPLAYDVVAEDASLTADAETVVVPAGSVKEMTFVLDPGSIEYNYAEGFISFKSADERYPDLNVPYLAYVGNWDNDFAIFDAPQMDGDYSVYAVLLDALGQDETKGRTGLFWQISLMGFAFEFPLGDLGQVSVPSDTIAFSPNADDFFDSAYARLGTFRGVNDLQVYVSESENPEDDHLRILNSEELIRKPSTYYVMAGRRNLYDSQYYAWDGTIYNDSNAGMMPAADGQYYIHARARMSEAGDWQYVTFPLYLDTVAPEMTIDKLDMNENTKTATIDVTVTDKGVGLNEGCFSIRLNGELLKESEEQYSVEAIKVENKNSGQYRITIPNIENDGPTPLEISVNDFAQNSVVETRELGPETYMILRQYSWDHSGQIYTGETYMGKKHLKYMPEFGAEAYGLEFEVQHSQNIKKVVIKDREVTPRFDPEWDKDLWYAFVPEEGGTYPLHVVGYDANDKVVYDETPVTIHFSTEAPSFELTKPIVEPNAEFGNLVFLKTETDTTTISGSLTNATAIQDITGTVKIESVDEPIAVAITTNGTFTVDVPLVLHDVYLVTLSNIYGNQATYSFRYFLESERDSVGEILNPEEPGEPGEPEEPIREPKVFFSANKDGVQFSDFTIINKELEDNMLEIVGSGRELAKLEIDGKEVDLTVIDKPFGKNYDFTVNVPIHSGMNNIGVKLYRFPLSTEEGPQIYSERKYQVLYDYTAPSVTVNLAPKAFEVEGEDLPVIYSKDGKVTVSGQVWDDTFGYDLYINGDHVKTWLDITEGGKEATIKNFEHETFVNDDGILQILVVDAFGNYFELEYKVIRDQIGPVITTNAPEDGTEFSIYDEELPLTLEAEAHDNLPEGPVPVTQYLNGEVYEGEEITEPGTYIYRAVAVDAAGNVAEIVRYFFIINEVPVINVDPVEVTIEAGGEFDPMMGVTASDAEDGDLTEEVEYRATFNTKVAGTYAIYYTVKDEQGQEATAVRYLTVLPSLNGWHVINGDVYYFENGTPVTGLRKIGQTTYLFDGEGKQQRGWHVVNGKQMYFNTENGGLWTGKRTIGQTTYLLGSDGGKLCGWHVLNGKKYYFHPEYGCGMVTGLRTINSNAKYFFRITESKPGANDRGSAVVNETLVLNGKKHTFNANGVLVKVEP